VAVGENKTASPPSTPSAATGFFEIALDNGINIIYYTIKKKGVL
jgi:hypothetical protein